MPSREAQVDRGPRSRRRTVRIVESRSTSRTATVSFLVTAAAAVLLFVIWRFWRADEIMPPEPRPLSQVTWKWECDAGHTFRASAHAEPRACPRCGRPAYPVDTWRCEEHGEFKVAVRFRRDAAGGLHPLEYRVADEDWTPAADGPYCPRCGRLLNHKPKDPFEDIPRTKKKKAVEPTRGG